MGYGRGGRGVGGNGGNLKTSKDENVYFGKNDEVKNMKYQAKSTDGGQSGGGNHVMIFFNTFFAMLF